MTETHRDDQQRAKARYEGGLRHIGVVSALLGGFAFVILGTTVPAAESGFLTYLIFAGSALSSILLVGATVLSSYLFFASKERDIIWNSNSSWPVSPFLMAFGASEMMMLSGLLIFFVTISLLSLRMGLVTGLIITLAVALVVAVLLGQYRSIGKHVDALNSKEAELSHKGDDPKATSEQRH